MKALLAALLSAVLSCAALAADPRPSRERDLGADHFAAGADLSLSAPVKGDLFAVSGNLDADAPVGGDAAIAGGNIRIGGTIAQDLYLAGGRLAVNGTVRRNARIAGGHVVIGPRARIEGNASLAGGDVSVAGPIGGYLQAGGGQVFLDSAVGGDVEIGGGTLELGPNARIGGKLRYASRDEIRQAPGAQVLGGIERIALPEHLRKTEPRETHSRAARGFAIAWAAGLVLLAAILGASLPRIFTATASSLRSRWGWALLAGFVVLACVPAAVLIALITVIGIPLALAALALYLALLLVGYASAGASLGILALQRWRIERTSHAGFRFLFAGLGMALVCLLAAIPWVGGLAALVALVLGTGLLAQRLNPA